MKKNFRASLLTTAGILLLLLSVMTGCSTPTAQIRPAGNIITGTITAGSIVLFPPQSVVEIVLVNEIDNAEAESESTLEIAKQLIKNPQVNPIKFSLRYDPEDIIEFRRYTVFVRVLDSDNNVLYIAEEGIPVLTYNNPDRVSVDLVSY